MTVRAETRWSPPVAVVILVLSLCGTVVSLMQTLVVPLLPDFPKLLDTTPTNASWLVTATLLTSAVATPIVSKLADMFGKRLMMLICLSTMIVGSAIGALGDTLSWLVLARTLQGFAPALIPVGISIMRDELPREKVGSAVALMSATLGVGAAIGLPLAGVIYAHLDWHALFWVSGGMGLIMLIAVPLVVSESEVRTRGRFDFFGAILLSAALTLLLLAISKGGHWGWTSEPTLASLVGAALILGVWVPWELRASQPLVDVRTSTRRPVLLTNCASVLVGFAMYGNMLSTTQLLQIPKATGYGFGLSVLDAGLSMLPAGLAMVAMAPVTATITRRYGAKVSLIVGALILAAGYIARVFMISDLWQIIFGAAVVSIGTAVAYAAMPTLIMAAVPITETAAANGLNTLLRAIGTSTSSASVAALLTASTIEVAGLRQPTVDAFQHIFWIAAFAALASAAVAVALPGRAVSTAEQAAVPAAAGVAARDVAPGGVTSTEREHEIVVQGAVLRQDDRPVRQAVVSVLRTSGEQVDWSRADNDGHWSVVLPEPGRYLVVSSADGWAPCSQVVSFPDGEVRPRLRLSQRLTVSGVIMVGEQPAVGVLVSLTRHSGESVGVTHTDEAGRYNLPLPPPGRYVLTALDVPTERVRSLQTLVGAQSKELDIDLAS
ncbi:MAG TPA: MFS transporter [Nocardioidaceae bacterium]|nr:MFS transporter [Nocardioidaceae bacterium]